MIRPLEFCETTAHIETSLDTIEQRIEELRALRQQYLEKLQQLTTVDTEQQGAIIAVGDAGEMSEVNQLASKF